MYNYELIKKRIKDLREDNDLKQVEFAEILGVKQSAISKYERDERKYAIEHIYKICKYFNVSADYILGLKIEQEVKK